MLLFPFSVNLISLLGEYEGQVTELNTTQVSLELSCKATTPRDFITAHGCCDLSYTYMQNDHSERKLGAAQGLLPFLSHSALLLSAARPVGAIERGRVLFLFQETLLLHYGASIRLGLRN